MGTIIIGIDLAKQAFSACVMPFRKQRSGKNDRNDAEAIATATRQDTMRFVPVKTVEQQARLSWHRLRIGLVPSQHSTGGRQRLDAISRDGDAYLRTLLIQGARSSLQRANAVAREKANAEQLWIRSLASRMPFGKVLVAIANKHARQLWAMLSSGQDYDPEAWLHHPMVQRPASARHRPVATA